MRRRRRFSAEFKEVALEAIKGHETVAELATKHELRLTAFNVHSPGCGADAFDEKVDEHLHLGSLMTARRH